MNLSLLRTAFLDLLFPLRCVNCGIEGSLICSSCSQALPKMEPPVCQRCGISLGEGGICSACIGHPLTIDDIRSPFLFEGTIRRAIHQLKYRHLKAIAIPLGQLMAEFFHSRQLPGDVLIPVPLHPKRLRERGYNQASLLAIEIGKLTGIPVVEGKLLRLRDTVYQARTTSAAERRNNVRDAFGCPQRLRGDNILLIDDVCTTGATLDACATALKAAGAGSIRGLTAARESFSSPTNLNLENRGVVA